MKNGWWKLQFNVTLGGAEIDFDELPMETKSKIMAQVSQGAVAGAFDSDADSGEKEEKADQHGICPLCGGELKYTDNEQMDNGGVYHCICTSCEATGKEGYDEVFDGHHYEVRDADGAKVPGRND